MAALTGYQRLTYIKKSFLIRTKFIGFLSYNLFFKSCHNGWYPETRTMNKCQFPLLFLTFWFHSILEVPISVNSYFIPINTYMFYNIPTLHFPLRFINLKARKFFFFLHLSYRLMIMYKIFNRLSCATWRYLAIRVQNEIHIFVKLKYLMR